MKLIRCQKWEFFYDYPCTTTLQSSTSTTLLINSEEFSKYNEELDFGSAEFNSTPDIPSATESGAFITTTAIRPTSIGQTMKTSAATTMTAIVDPTLIYRSNQNKEKFNFWPSVIITTTLNIVILLALLLIYKKWTKPRRYRVSKITEDDEFVLERTQKKRSRAARDAIINDARISPSDSLLSQC